IKLINKNLVLGIGCKKNMEYKKLFYVVNAFLKRNGYLIEAISHLASAWVKKEETAIIQLKNKLNIKYITYGLEEIKDIENLFNTSDFVRKTIGVGCVSEPCGYLGSNKGKCLVKLEKLDGITLSLWEMKG
ncbi:MAG: cobalamin biosynthesis protein, partial [Bacillota bacterium]|nr:cobalamin biosynthesis protein [Bacillota bacterium]